MTASQEGTIQLIRDRLDPESSTLNLSGLGLRSIAPLGTLIRANHVTKLDLSRNNLSDIPREIRWLPALRELDLSYNSLTYDARESFQDPKHELFEFVTELRSLNLRHNLLKDIPAAVYYLPNLRRLDVSRNEIDALTRLNRLRGLDVLFLSANPFHTLPKQYAQLTTTRVVLEAHSITSPPPEVVKQGHKAILSFFMEGEEGATAPQWSSKILFVGEAGTGKTSAMRRLTENTFDRHQKTTHGINTTMLRLDHPRKRVTMELNCWDFGGQQIYHATHQFYLSTRSLYLLFWNARLGWEQGRLHYWLELIKARAPRSPVIVVATHVDERFAEVPTAELFQKYPDIVGFASISGLTCAGISDLREKIRTTVANLPLMGEEWPASWSEAAQAVRDINELYIEPKRLKSILSGKGVAADNVPRLITTLHELGDLLYFADDPTLNDIVILLPKALTDHIARVLDSKVLRRTSGVLTRSHSRQLWSDLEANLHTHFLRLMEKFDLSYRIDTPGEEQYLIVERLPLDPPAYDRAWDE